MNNFWTKILKRKIFLKKFFFIESTLEWFSGLVWCSNVLVVVFRQLKIFNWWMKQMLMNKIHHLVHEHGDAPKFCKKWIVPKSYCKTTKISLQKHKKFQNSALISENFSLPSYKEYIFFILKKRVIIHKTYITFCEQIFFTQVI